MIRKRRVVIVGVTQRADVAQFILRSAKRHSCRTLKDNALQARASLVVLNPFAIPSKCVQPSGAFVVFLLFTFGGCNIRRGARRWLPVWTNSFRELSNWYTPHSPFCCISPKPEALEGQNDSLHHASKMGESCNLLEVSRVFDERDTVWLWCRFPFWSAVGMMGNNGAERACLVWWIHRASEGTRRKWSAAATDGWMAEERKTERERLWWRRLWRCGSFQMEDCQFKAHRLVWHRMGW